MTLLKLCFVFFYIGLFTIGGGQVAITLMQQELMEKGLVTPEKFFNMVAISESTPGPIGINMATYLGCELYGVLGGILATLSTILPSIIIILLIAMFMKNLKEKPLVKAAFSCVKPVVAGLIAVALWNVMKISLLNLSSFSFSNLTFKGFLEIFDIYSLCFYFIGIIFLMAKKMHPIAVIALGALFGIIFL